MRSSSYAKKFAKSQLPYWGWKGQWPCLKELWTRESNWRPNALNKTYVRVLKDGKWIKVRAGGLIQMLGLNPATPVTKQVNLGLTYIKARHFSPCRALAFHKRNGYY